MDEATTKVELTLDEIETFENAVWKKMEMNGRDLKFVEKSVKTLKKLVKARDDIIPF